MLGFRYLLTVQTMYYVEIAIRIEIEQQVYGMTREILIKF